MPEPNFEEEKPSESKPPKSRLFGVFWALVPSAIILFAGPVILSPINHYTISTQVGLFCIDAVFSYIGSRMIFRGDMVLTVIFTIFFMILNAIISLFIGCAESMRMGF
jgi:hypothetical protein